MKKILFVFLVIINLTSFAQTESARLVEKGLSKSNSGKYDEAIDLFNQAIKLNPDYLDAYLKRAYVNSILKNYEASIQDYSKIIEINPNLVIAHVSRGSAYSKLKIFDSALEDFNTAIGLDPKNAEAFNNRGWVKKALGDKEGACEDWTKSKKLGNDEAKIILKNNKC